MAFMAILVGLGLLFYLLLGFRAIEDGGPLATLGVYIGIVGRYQGSVLSDSFFRTPPMFWGDRGHCKTRPAQSPRSGAMGP